ncbi:AAA family ATPase [Saccharopolyspora sp. 5N102]|uniref:helix-turn-helix transcriptional regulator n=1 Tax=Saccharopolyspora sp. 5N102 TaxID=3375155 RepID=UPI003798D438
MASGRAAPEIFGRESELRRLRELVGDVAAKRGSAIWLEGESGIGKTALLSRLTDEAERLGCQVFHSSADRLAHRFPLRVALDCLDINARAADATYRDICSRLHDGDQLDRVDPLPAVVERLVGIVEHACTETPVVMVIDDIHWADEASMLVWHQLNRLVDELPLLMVAAARPLRSRIDLGSLQQECRAGATLIPLPPLDAEAVTRLAGHLTGTAEIGPAMRRTLERAGGNPLYVRELVDSLSREGHVAKRDGGRVADLPAEVAEPPLPRSLAESLTSRLSFVNTDTIGLLRMAALLGQTFSVTDLRKVSERPVVALAGAMEEALAAGLLVESGSRLAFQHGLIRHALCETTPTALRVALHNQAARALAESGAPIERVGEQLRASLAIDDTELDDGFLDWLAHNGRMLAYRAPESATELLSTALSLLPTGDARRGALQAAKARTLVALGRPEQAQALCERVLAETRDRCLASEMSWYLAWSLAVRGLDEQAAEVVERALRTPGFERPWLARMHAMLGQVMLVRGEFESANSAVKQALSEARPVHDGFALGLALHVRAAALARQCDLAGAVDCYDQARAELDDAPENTDLRLLVLGNRMVLLFGLGRAEDAESALHEMLAIAERTATPTQLASVRLSAANHYYTTGRWDDAVAELDAVVELADRMPRQNRRCLHGLSALIAGHREDAETFGRKLAGVDDPGPESLEGAEFLLLGRGMQAEMENAPQRAVALLTEVLLRGERFGTRYLWLPLLVRLAMSTGDTAAGTRAAQACEDDAAVGAVPNIVAAAQHCRGLLDREPAAVRAAAEIYRTINQPPRHAQALEDLAVLLAERGQISAARAEYARAVEIYTELGASWDLRRADARLRPHGVRRARGRRPRATTGWDSLTPTERKVARLVADGLANPDIAATLFSSRRTIEVHVSHILAKLGVRSRVEVAVIAMRNATNASRDGHELASK